MKTTRLSMCVIVAALFTVSGPGLRAQLAAPGESGVVMGHLHLAAKDLDAQRKFWAELGGTPVQNGPLALIQLPGTFVMLRQAEPSGGTVGSTINHVGFLVKDIAPPEAMDYFVAAAFSVPVLVYIAYLFGGQIDNVIKYARRAEHGILVAVVIVAAIVVIRLMRRRRKRLARLAAEAAAE